MTPVYLQRAALHCALGEDLHTAALAMQQGRTAPAGQFQLHEVHEPRSYLYAAQTGESLTRRLNRLISETLCAQPQALDDCLLIVASTSLDIADLETQTREHHGFQPGDSTSLDLIAKQLRQSWGFAAAFTLNTACTSAANGLLYAARLLNTGQYTRSLVLSFETPSAIAMQGFGALGLTSPSGQYRPFHPERDGLILGEAYCAALLSREPSANPLESNGIRLLYGAQMPTLSLLKPWLGHTLGACGLSESLLLLGCLREGPLPGVAYANSAMLPLSAAPQPLPADSMLLANFFGFGGNNASLVMQGCMQGESPCR